MFRKLTFLLLFLLVTTGSFAQGYTKEIKQKFIDAEYYLISENYEQALKFYRQVHQFDSLNYNVIYRIGLCYLNIPFQTKLAIPYLEKAITNINPKYNEGSYKETKADPDALYYLGAAYQQSYRFNDAIKIYSKYKNLLDVKKLYFINKVDRQIAACKYSQEILKSPATVASKSLGTPINSSKHSNYNPCLSADDSVLVYSRSIPHKSYNKETDVMSIKMHNRIMMCKRTADGWSAPVDISMQLKTEGSAIPISLSPDGKTLYLYRNNVEKKLEKDRGTMYSSNFVKNKWTAIKKLPGAINTDYDETHASMSSDGRTLYFTSDRRDGSIGGIDIYYTTKLDDTTWSNPENMGPNINTPLNEEAPFILNDNLLFFSSEGHNTMGGYDLFYSRKTASGWTEPINIRPPINTPNDDLFFVPVLSGKRAYHAIEVPDSNNVMPSSKEIYSFELSLDDLEKQNIAAVKENSITAASQSEKSSGPTPRPVIGSISTSDNKALIPSIKVTIQNANTKQIIATLNPDYKTNTYNTNLLPGSYLVVVEGDAYSKSEQVVYVSNINVSRAIISTVLVPKEIASGQYVAIKTVFFDQNSSVLTREAQIELERINALLQENPSLNVELMGYVDPKSGASQPKASVLIDSVTYYLQTRGIEAQRFVSNTDAPSVTKSKIAQSTKQYVEIKLVRTDNLKIVTENLALPDDIAYKEYIRFSVMVARQNKPLTSDELNKYKAAGLPKLEFLQVNNEYIYYAGDCKHKADAVVLLNKVEEAGFALAEITDYFKTNRLTAIQAPTATVSVNDATKLSSDDDDDMSLSDDLGSSAAAPPQWFTIQICTLNAPDDKKKKDEKVLVYHCKDGLYRYIYGIYTSIEEAQVDLPKILQWGFSDAFIAQGSRYSELECECNR